MYVQGALTTIHKCVTKDDMCSRCSMNKKYMKEDTWLMVKILLDVCTTYMLT